MLHPLSNFPIIKYFNYKPSYNGLFSRGSLPLIIHKMFEANSNFHENSALREKLVSDFQNFLPSINKIFIFAGRLGTRLSFPEL